MAWETEFPHTSPWQIECQATTRSIFSSAACAGGDFAAKTATSDASEASLVSSRPASERHKAPPRARASAIEVDDLRFWPAFFGDCVHDSLAGSEIATGAVFAQYAAEVSWNQWRGPALLQSITPIEGADPMDTDLPTPKDRPQRSLILEQRAREILDSHSHFSGRTRVFKFEVWEDVMVVRGRVPTYYLKQMLQNALKDLPDVRWIDNQVTVVSEYGISTFDS